MKFLHSFLLLSLIGTAAAAATKEDATKAELRANLRHLKKQHDKDIQKKNNLRRTTTKTKPHDQVLRSSINRAGKVQPRIIGGSKVKNPVPYFGLWEVGCGATLIHDDLALTAAHVSTHRWLLFIIITTGTNLSLVCNLSPLYFFS